MTKQCFTSFNADSEVAKIAKMLLTEDNLLKDDN